MKAQQNERVVNLLLADDDRDDRFFFKMALKKLSFPTQLTTVDNGERLMTYLFENYTNLPDILFLDLNMPRKNGAECLLEIKQNELLKNIPVIIYSTALSDSNADVLFNNGAHYYISKRNLSELEEILAYLITIFSASDFSRPEKNGFILKQINYRSGV